MKVVKKKSRFLVNFAKSLFLLKQQETKDVAVKLGIPHANLIAFIKGMKMSIAPEHAVKLFYYLGIGKNFAGKVGYQANCVHNFILNVKDLKKIARPVLQTAFKILPEYQARLVFQNSTNCYVLVAHEDIRIVLNITKGFFQPFNIQDLGLKRFKDQKEHQAEIPLEYKKSLQNGTLGLLDFDSIYFNVYEDWANLRSIANIHGIPFASILNFLKTEARKTRRYSIVDFQKAIASTRTGNVLPSS